MAIRPDPAVVDEFVFSEIDQHPKDLSRLVAERFGISRQAAAGHLRRLVRKGELLPAGETRSRSYSLRVSAEERFALNVTPDLEEHEVWSSRALPLLGDLKPNILSICNYGFTEILNNAKDHSEANAVQVWIQRTAANVVVWMNDDGVGIFEKIKRAVHLDDERHALLELVKGKFTTDPARHTGEGIFFTSRMFDEFGILSGNLSLIHLREQEDWLIEDREPTAGTSVRMQIAARSTHTDKEVFDKYVVDQDDYAFKKTHLLVALSRREGENLVSRSQAKRLMARLERFSEVCLDFKGIASIGPAFADEVFRVFQSQHPDLKITAINESDEVRQMVHRALSEARVRDEPRSS
jgi:hypothetical protein